MTFVWFLFLTLIWFSVNFLEFILCKVLLVLKINFLWIHHFIIGFLHKGKTLVEIPRWKVSLCLATEIVLSLILLLCLMYGPLESLCTLFILKYISLSDFYGCIEQLRQFSGFVLRLEFYFFWNEILFFTLLCWKYDTLVLADLKDTGTTNVIFWVHK